MIEVTFRAVAEDLPGAALLDQELEALVPRCTLVVATHEPERLGTLATARLALGVA